jgi:ribonucleotide monophosphatase NagD (HAD superfamily)
MEGAVVKIAIDFDGVISQYNGFKGKGIFGPPIEGARKAISYLKSKKHTIIINTTRLEIDKIAEYLKKEEIPYDHINFSPDNVKNQLHPAKQVADIYIDDRGCCFKGDWSKEFLDDIENFRPWWK